MSSFWGGVARQARKESLDAISLSHPTKIIQFVLTSLAAGALTWWLKADIAISAACTVGVTLLCIAGDFTVRMFTIPARLAGENAARLAVLAPHGGLRRDVPFDEAIYYSVTGEWGQPLSFDTAMELDEPMKDIHQLMADGEITAWGKTSDTGMYVEIPRSYWLTYQLDYLSVLGGINRTEGIMGTIVGGTFYHSVMLNKAQVEAALALLPVVGGQS